jgi:hypothetical protein
MPAKVTGMSATRVPARTIRPGKEHARLVVAGIITFPGIWHKFSIINSKVSGTRCSIKAEASRDIKKMMGILPLRGQDTSNLSNSSISRTSNMSNTSKTIWLNNLPAGSINGWMDFEEQFVSNFTSTYKRPNRPQQLVNC